MQNKKLTIALDCDDVLFDCNEEAVRKLNKACGTHYGKTDIKTWGYTGSLLDERIRFFEDPGFVSSQKLLPGAKEFVQQLLSMDAVKDIVLVTAVLPQCASARYQSIIRLLPEINPNNVVITCNKSCIQADIMLDDGVHNLDSAVHIKNRVLFNQPWNAKEDRYFRVKNYEEFIHYVQSNNPMF